MEAFEADERIMERVTDKMITVTDMFLTEFPYHPFSKIRIGTIVTRFKGCFFPDIY